MTDEQFALIAKTFPFLADRSPSDLAKHHISLSRLSAGTLALREGELCSAVVFVLRGSVRVYKVGENGRELTLYRVAPGESCVLMLSSVLAGVEYPAVAVVEEETDALMIPIPTFRTWMDTNRFLQQFVYQLFTLRLVSVTTLVEEIVFRKVDQRVADYLLKRTSVTQTVLHITHDELAVELGTAREVISRIMKEFEKEGLIQLSRGRVQVLHRDLLQHKSE